MSIGLAGLAQFQFDFTQAYTMPYALNPAFSGIEACMDIKASARMRVDDAQFAAKTNFVGISIDIASLRYADGIRESKTMRARHGVSMFVLQDEFGPYKSFNGAIAYAYHVPLSSSFSLTAGAAGDFTSARIDLSELVPNDANDDVYIRLLNGGTSRSVADLTLGGTLYHNRFYIGYSAFRLARRTFKESEWNSPRISYQSVQAGFNVPLSINLQFYGSGVARLERDELIWDASAKFRYHDFLWAGTSYRSTGSVSGLAGFVYRNIQINYSYNYAYSALLGWSTHELSVGCFLFRKDMDKLVPFIL